MTHVTVKRIQVPSSTVPGERPPNTLKHGELWVNSADAVVYAGIDGGTPVLIGGGSGGGSATLPSQLDAGIYV